MKRTKDEVQQEALTAFETQGSNGILAMATGTGKSKIAIDYAVKLQKDNFELRVLVVVPTEKLRDVNWKDEFFKWKASFLWNNNVERSCYQSIHKIEGEVFDLVILDEAHRITELNSVFFKNNTIRHIMGLTATPPTDFEKQRILDELGLEIVYRVTLDQAVEWGLVSPYKIKVINVSLDNSEKYIKAGNKAKPFYQTELAAYTYYTAQVDKCKQEYNFVKMDMWVKKRMHLLYNLKTKTNVTKFLLDRYISKDERTLIFAGTTEQADSVCEDRYHSKSKTNSFDLFANGYINRLSSVKALNEGHNIMALDNAFIIQINSNELHLIQRIGRIIRFREGHVGNIYIMCVKGTVDEKWLQNALSEIDESNIEYINYSLLKMELT